MVMHIVRAIEQDEEEQEDPAETLTGYLGHPSFSPQLYFLCPYNDRSSSVLGGKHHLQLCFSR